MRRILVLVLAAGASGVLLWSVAPALSLTPYLPEAVDFEQALPTVQRVDGDGQARAARAGGGEEGPVRFRTPVIEAPKRFDLVGVAGEMEELEYRARRAGAAWSRWVEASNGDPVYFGGADHLQVRSRGVRPEGRLHYVNVSGTETVASRVLTGARQTVNSALVGIASTVSAAAAPAQPAMVGRGKWGANRNNGGCKPRSSPQRGSVKAAVVHHTVTANDYSASEAPGIVLAICRYHRNGNGWSDIGYNFLVDRFGTIYVGRAGGKKRAVVGAHAQGFNSQTTGVASLGTHTRSPATKQARNAIIRVIAWKLALHGTQAKGKTRLLSGGGSVNRYPRGRRITAKRVMGHKRVNSTACPGKRLNSALKKIRKRAQKRIDRNASDEPPPEEEENGNGGTGAQRR